MEAICNVAIEKGLIFIALAQALQFELTLRQVDVIGVWKKTEDIHAGGILDRGQRWRDGLLWAHLDSNGVLKKETTKVDDVIAERHDAVSVPSEDDPLGSAREADRPDDQIGSDRPSLSPPSFRRHLA